MGADTLAAQHDTSDANVGDLGDYDEETPRRTTARLQHSTVIKPLLQLLKKLLRGLFVVLMLPILLFEEWGWDPLARMMARLASHRMWAALEKRICKLPPWAALLSFMVPVLLLLPVKLMALWLFAEGHMASGLLLLGGAKLAGTALVARIFQLTQPALMQIAFFARWYFRWKRWKDGVLQAVRAHRLWRAARHPGVALRRRWRCWRRNLRAWGAS